MSTIDCRECGGIVAVRAGEPYNLDSICECGDEFETYTDKQGNPVNCADRPY